MNRAEQAATAEQIVIAEPEPMPTAAAAPPNPPDPPGGYRPLRKLDKVAIVGFASHWQKTPFLDPSFEIWALNEFYNVAPEQIKAPQAEGRLRWFEIHRRDQPYDGNPFFLHSRDTDHAAKLTALGCPVYMQRHWDDIPNSVEYPKDEVIRRYTGYLTNSISWMIALALMEGFPEIHIYGVDMAQDSEYGTQRPSCEFFIGVMHGMGIKWVIPEDCDLCKAEFLYGWESHHISTIHAKLTARIQELRQRRFHNEKVVQEARDSANQFLGAEQNSVYVLNAFAGIRAGKPTP